MQTSSDKSDTRAQPPLPTDASSNGGSSSMIVRFWRYSVNTLTEREGDGRECVLCSGREGGGMFL